MKLLTIPALAVALLQGTTRQLHIEVAGTFSVDHRRGIELATTELAQTASLLGATVTVSEKIGEQAIGRVFGSALSTSHSGVPVVHLTTESWGPSERQCEFRIQPSAGAVTWQSSSSRFGASELNERYRKRFAAPMTGEAWNAWFAVKALVENALRAPAGADLCESMARTRFDGHKGEPLFFDPKTRLLQQPLYDK